MTILFQIFSDNRTKHGGRYLERIFIMKNEENANLELFVLYASIYIGAYSSLLRRVDPPVWHDHETAAELASAA